MKKIAFIFTRPPHGSSSGREGLDAALATSALTDNIALYFIGDGVFQLLDHQNPSLILSRHYAATFGILALYDITECYLCDESIAQRCLQNADWCIDAKRLPQAEIRAQLATFDAIFTF